MTEKMLIPLDGSSFGEGALKYVENLVDKLRPGRMPEIILLQVISPTVLIYLAGLASLMLSAIPRTCSRLKT